MLAFRYFSLTLSDSNISIILTILPLNSGPSFLKSFQARQTQPRFHQLNYMRYWTKQLSLELTQGIPVYFMSTPMQQDVLVDYFIQSFQLKEVLAPIWEPIDATSRRAFTFYRVRRHLPPAKSKLRYREPPTLSTIENCLQLISGSVDTDGSATSPRIIIKAQLDWRIANKIPYENYFVQFRFIPQYRNNKTTLFESKKKKWQATRRLSKMRILNKLKRATTFSEEYQLQVPINSLPGTYQLELSIISIETKERFVMGEEKGEEIYFLPVCEFDLPEVLDSESVARTP